MHKKAFLLFLLSLLISSSCQVVGEEQAVAPNTPGIGPLEEAVQPDEPNPTDIAADATDITVNTPTEESEQPGSDGQSQEKPPH